MSIERNSIVAIADDLTGALEVGAHFANSVVTTDPAVVCLRHIPALVIDSETRHVAPEHAFRSVHRIVTNAVQYGPRLVFKKTDSTLRGNIAAEFRALLCAMPGHSIVYAPAYPAMGRTVIGGRLFVHGIPVHQSAFASDRWNPVSYANISELLADIPVEVLDGESDADLEAAARDILRRSQPVIAAGTGALAGILAAILQSGPGSGKALPRLSRCLVVNGSMHPVSEAQLEFARAHRCFDDAWVCFDCVSGAEGIARAARTGERVRTLLSESHFDALIVFGGDTAFGIHRALGSDSFYPCGEVVPGVPISKRGGLYWITKAGGFGAPDLLCDIRTRLS